MSNDFKRQFDEALREAEREVGPGGHQEAAAGAPTKPLSDIRKDFDATMRVSSTPRPQADAVARAGEAGGRSRMKRSPRRPAPPLDARARERRGMSQDDIEASKAPLIEHLIELRSAADARDHRDLHRLHRLLLSSPATSSTF